MCKLLVVWRSRERHTVVYAEGSTPQKQHSKKWQQNVFFTVDLVNHMLATFFFNFSLFFPLRLYRKTEVFDVLQSLCCAV